MHSRLVRLIGCATVWAFCACGEQPTEVELQLYPCDLTSGLPTSVDLTIQSSGADGKIGEPLVKTFPISEPEKVFEDGFATVGFTPPAGTLTADITVLWTAGSEVVQARYNLGVPALGEAMPLGKEECESGPSTTTTPTTTDEPTTVGTDTTGSGSETETGTTTTTDPTETTSTSSTSSTSTGDSETTTESTTTTTDTTTSTTDTTMGTSGGPMEGGTCMSPGLTACDAGPGALGQLLVCQDTTWVLLPDFCQPSACENLGFTNPQAVGCFGDEQGWSCACAETPQGQCEPGQVSQCGEAIGMDGDVKVELCVDDVYYAAQCAGCIIKNGKPLCITD
ncbi:hypothetical protein [Nannocystis sp. SCPEA4]|uniref:hypothetical protein n=1 Tax=Nannocystis sp. SCPEA4 TaxID=2996787 RepID=UPI00226DB0FB|nr:hypothetical protein [Nannocystis sp. SCPEA4]MCY1057237.1 hypothetical protein [Nannocystis sp. SCPEA4]